MSDFSDDAAGEWGEAMADGRLSTTPQSEFDKELTRILRDYWQADTEKIAELVKQAIDKYVIPSRPDNSLIQESLQQGKPQQAASYNGYAAAIDESRKNLWGDK